MKDWGTIDRKDSNQLAREYGKMLAKLRLSPNEIKQRIDFQIERESILNEQFTELQTKIEERDAEIQERQKAEKALEKARDELEVRVEQRTAELASVNKNLKQIFDTMRQGIVAFDHEGKLVGMVSAQARSILHEDALEGKQLAPLLYPDDPAKAANFQAWVAEVFFGILSPRGRSGL